MMNQSAIFEPVVVMLILTMVVWVYMYSKRIPFIRKSKLTPAEMTPGNMQKISPPAVANPSDNLKNLFEIPILFYVVALLLFVSNQVDQTYLVAAWVFVVFRIFHSAVHCTFNAIILRFSLYVVATLAFWFIVLRIAMGMLLN